MSLAVITSRPAAHSRTVRSSSCFTCRKPASSGAPDEVAIQIAMQSLLESWGYEAITAGSCDEMLERIATHRTAPRLIISDYRLRDNASGIDAIERLRTEYNDEIPGMLITGDTAADRLREAQESGFLLLHKPVPNHRLRASLAHLIAAGDKAVA